MSASATLMRSGASRGNTLWLTLVRKAPKSRRRHYFPPPEDSSGGGVPDLAQTFSNVLDGKRDTSLYRLIPLRTKPFFESRDCR
ncbi:MAG: hypothetical protein KatS3mg023_1792 [Armatimonadota bacterium]|nr:MAG: hypothetical protein KatS3mg023_1792 [Armatimonadota bacterium]